MLTLRMMIGCLAGFCSNKFLKYGEQAHKIILWAFVCWPWTLKLYAARHNLSGKYLCCDCYIAEALLIPEVFEGGDHVSLEVIPAQAELLVVGHGESADSSAMDQHSHLGMELQGHHACPVYDHPQHRLWKFYSTSKPWQVGRAQGELICEWHRNMHY